MDNESNEGPRKLGLMRFVLGSPCILEIEQETADLLVRATKAVREIVSIEQKFSILIENFLELEQELATRVIRNAYLSRDAAQDFFDDKQAFNRRTINILTATRLYTDQAKHHIKALFPSNPEKWEELNKSFSKHYDDHLSFRVMEALRNYTQHRGLPLQGLTMSARWIDQEDDARSLEYNAAINIIVDDLEVDGKFKKSVLNELKVLGGEKGIIDIKSFVREYIQSISDVHQHFRVMTDDLIKESTDSIIEWKAKYAEFCSDDATHYLAIGWENANRTRERIAYLSADAMGQLKTLRARTRSTVNLAKRFTTTAPLKR